jgi:hypothetical protein
MQIHFTDTSERGFQKFITNYLVSEHRFRGNHTQRI